MQPIVATGFSAVWPVVRRAIPMLGISLFALFVAHAEAPAPELVEIDLVSIRTTLTPGVSQQIAEPELTEPEVTDASCTSASY